MAGRAVSFYTDVHIPLAVVKKLREAGMDVLRAQEIGLHDASDHIHLEAALTAGRVIVTKGCRL